MAHKNAMTNPDPKPARKRRPSERVKKTDALAKPHQNERPPSDRQRAIRQQLEQTVKNNGGDLADTVNFDTAAHIEHENTPPPPQPQPKLEPKLERARQVFLKADLRDQENVGSWEEFQKRIPMICEERDISPEERPSIETIATNIVLNLRNAEGVLKKVNENSNVPEALAMQARNLLLAKHFLALLQDEEFRCQALEIFHDLSTNDLDQLSKELKEVPLEPMTTVQTTTDLEALAESIKAKKAREENIFLLKVHEVFVRHEEILKEWANNSSLQRSEVAERRTRLTLSEKADLLIDRLLQWTNGKDDTEEKRAAWLLLKAVIAGLEEQHDCIDLFDLLGSVPKKALIGLAHHLDENYEPSDKSHELDTAFEMPTKGYKRLDGLALAATGQLDIGSAILVSIDQSRSLLHRLETDARLQDILDEDSRQECTTALEAGLGYVSKIMVGSKNTKEYSTERMQAGVTIRQAVSHLKDIRSIIKKLIDKVDAAAKEGHRLIPALPEDILTKLSILEALALDLKVFNKKDLSLKGIQHQLILLRAHERINHPADLKALDTFESMAKSALNDRIDHTPGKNVAAQELVGFMIQDNDKEAPNYERWLNQILIRLGSEFLALEGPTPRRKDTRQWAQETFRLEEHTMSEVKEEQWECLERILHLRKTLEAQFSKTKKAPLQTLVKTIDHLTRRFLPPHNEKISLNKMANFLSGLAAYVIYTSNGHYITRHFEEYQRMVETYALGMKTLENTDLVSNMLKRVEDTVKAPEGEIPEDGETDEDWDDFLGGLSFGSEPEE